MKDFHSPTGLTFNLPEVVQEIVNYIKEDMNQQYKVIIGTDSSNHEEVDFISAVVIYRLGHGGRFFWRRLRLPFKNHNLRQRIHEEVLISLKLSEELLSYLTKEKELNFDFEVHVDIGSRGETRLMLQEIIGMVRGSGFEVKIKPESYGASKVADRYC